jgi:MFS family permease
MAAQEIGSERDLRAELLLTVYVPAMLLAFGQGILITTLPLYAADFTSSYSLISFAVSAAALGTLVMDVPAGAILGRLGLRPTMLGGTLMVVLGTLPLAFIHRYDLVLALRILSGVGTAFWGLSRHALIASAAPPEQRGRVLSTFGGINRLGVLLGPAAGGIIADLFGLRASFVLSGAMGLAAFVLAVKYVRATTLSQERGSGRWAIVGKTLKTYARDLSAAGAAQTFAQVIRSGRQLILPLYASRELGLGPAEIGFVMTASSVLDVVMFVPAGILMDRFGRKTASVPSFAIMAIGMALIPLAHSFWPLLLVGTLIGAGNGLGSGAMMTLGADLAPPGATGEFLGIWRLIGDSGSFLGPTVVGVIAGWFSLQGSAYALAVFGIMATLTLGLLVRETRVSRAISDPVDRQVARSGST